MTRQVSRGCACSTASSRSKSAGSTAASLKTGMTMAMRDEDECIVLVGGGASTVDHASQGSQREEEPDRRSKSDCHMEGNKSLLHECHRIDQCSDAEPADIPKRGNVGSSSRCCMKLDEKMEHDSACKVERCAERQHQPPSRRQHGPSGCEESEAKEHERLQTDVDEAPCVTSAVHGDAHERDGC